MTVLCEHSRHSQKTIAKTTTISAISKDAALRQRGRAVVKLQSTGLQSLCSADPGEWRASMWVSLPGCASTRVRGITGCDDHCAGETHVDLERELIAVRRRD